MRIGFIGLGKMGYHMVKKLLAEGKEVVVYNRSPQKTDQIAKEGAISSYSLEEFMSKLGDSKIVWLMVPHETVDEMIKQVVPLMKKGDLLIDGGNSNFNDSKRRALELEKIGIPYLDIGVSGGLAAANTGYCMMIGGPSKEYMRVEPFIRAMCVKDGYAHVGPSGAGHFVKMTHNAIEYGIMEALGEGFELLQKSEYDLDYLQVAKLWNNGSIIRSFLMEMSINAFTHHKNLEDVSGAINDSGEGRWAVQEAMRLGVPFTINSHALFSRYRSRTDNSFSNRLVAALRDEFGGHGFLKGNEQK